MKFYFAAPFDTQAQLRGFREILVNMGHQVTSRWLDAEGGALNAQSRGAAASAIMDAADLAKADLVVVFTKYGPSTTGGMHVELGLALARLKPISLVGPPTNIFHALPMIEQFPGWTEFVTTLKDARL